MKTFSTAIVLGLFGAAAASLSFMMQWPTWVMFLAWVSYYVFGKQWQHSIRTFIQIVLGICMGVLIQLTAALLNEIISPFGFALAVFLYIGSFAFIAKSKTMNNIPAYFFGLIILFGVHPPLQPIVLLELLVPIVSGFVFALLNDLAVLRVTMINSRTSSTH